MIPSPLPIAVLLSGRGSNFLALQRASRQPDAGFVIAVVISDKATARGLEKARRLGIPAFHLAPKTYADKAAYETQLVELLQRHQVRLVCLAGYMRLVGPTLLAAFPERILNIHPALLPAFPGLDAQAQALAHGVRVSGCTVHFVDAGVDSGPIVMQKAVPVLPDDDEDSLSRRILRQEHRLYPQVVRLFCQGRLRMDGRRVAILPPTPTR